MTGELERREPTRLDELARLGTWLAYSESGDESPTARGAAAALRLYYAGQLGLPPLAASELSIIKGKLAVSTRLLRAFAQKAGYRVTRIESTTETCTAILSNGDGTEIGRSTFTIEDAKRANLIRDRGTWTTHPARMLWHRAAANVIYDFIPEVALGLMTDEEADEIAGVIIEEFDDEYEQARYVPAPEPPAEPSEDAPEPPAGTEPPAAQGRAGPPAADHPAAAAGPLPEAGPELAADKTKRLLWKRMREAGLGDLPRPDRLAYVSAIAGREIKSSAELHEDEARQVIDDLERRIAEASAAGQEPEPTDEIPF